MDGAEKASFTEQVGEPERAAAHRCRNPPKFPLHILLAKTQTPVAFIL